MLRVVERDSVPLVDRAVVLHEVTLTRGGPVDTAVTDRAGRYRLRTAARDTTATYIVSVEHDGIGYFSDPVHTFEQAASAALTLLVYDTTQAGPPIAVAERHFVIRAPQEDGVRRVVEFLVLRNEGTTTRISADSSEPVWAGALPSGALQFEVGESDVSAQAVSRSGDSVLVFTPIPPGERQLLVTYVLPQSSQTFTVPVTPAVGMLNLLLEDTSATVTGGPLTLAGVERLDDVPFRRFSGGPVAEGTPISVQFARPALTLRAFWWVIVVVAGLVLAFAFSWWWRAHGARPATGDPDVIAGQIVMLDAGFERAKERATAQQRDDYRRRRAELKQRLTEALRTRP